MTVGNRQRELLKGKEPETQRWKATVLVLNLAGDHQIIDEFTWKSLGDHNVANMFIDEELQTEMLAFIQGSTYLVAELEDLFPSF